MSDQAKGVSPTRSTDLVLDEIWRIKDEQSAARGNDVHRLFAQARERQKRSGHRLVNLETKDAATG